MIEALLSLTGLVALAVFLLWAAGGKTIYEANGSGIIEALPGAVEDDRFTPGEILVFACNLCYGLGSEPAGRSRTELITVYERLDQLLEMIALSGAEIVALQEVDFASRRSGNIDQLHYLAAALGWKYVARVFTWECRYVPMSWRRPWRYGGKVRAGQGVISRYPLVQNIRQRLQQATAQPLWAPLFEPHPTVQMVEILCGERTIRLFHGSMDQTTMRLRQRQAETVVTFVRDTVTPNSLVIGTFGREAAQASNDQELTIITTGLQDRLSLVPLTDAATFAQGRFLPCVLVGPGLHIPATETVRMPESVISQPPLLVTVHWALPPGQRSNGNHTFQLL